MLINRVDPAQAANVNPHVPCCTLEDFWIDLAGTPASAWNKSAGRTFVNSLIDISDYPNTPEMRQIVFEAYTT